MSDGEFWERVIHTPLEEVPGLRDHTAGQVLMKMASLDETAGRVGTELRVRWNRDLGLELVTPLGVYCFVLDAEGERVVVDQVL